jgi:hypothetical protein
MFAISKTQVFSVTLKLTVVAWLTETAYCGPVSLLIILLPVVLSWVQGRIKLFGAPG